jgi:hypothetical protein
MPLFQHKHPLRFSFLMFCATKILDVGQGMSPYREVMADQDPQLKALRWKLDCKLVCWVGPFADGALSLRDSDKRLHGENMSRCCMFDSPWDLFWPPQASGSWMHWKWSWHVIASSTSSHLWPAIHIIATVFYTKDIQPNPLHLREWKWKEFSLASWVWAGSKLWKLCKWSSFCSTFIASLAESSWICSWSQMDVRGYPKD